MIIANQTTEFRKIILMVNNQTNFKNEVTYLQPKKQPNKRQILMTT